MKPSILKLEKRNEHRVNLYRGELAPIVLSWADTTLIVQGYDLATNGIGVIIPNLGGSLPPLFSQVSLLLPQSESKIEGVITHSSQVKFDGKICQKLGIQFAELARLAVLRDKQRYNLISTKLQAIHLHFEHPSFSGCFVGARIIDLSYDGVSFAVDLQVEAILTRSMVVLGKVVLPSGGEFEARFEVRHSRVDADFRIYGCRLLEVSSRFSQEMAEYLLSNMQGPSIRQLLTEGFEVITTAKALRFGYANKKEYQEILRLRRDLAHFEDRLLEVEDEERFTVEFDEYCRHLYCKISGRIVGAGRILFNSDSAERSDICSRGISISKSFWQHGFVEVSHLFIDPEFQGADIFLNILRQMIRIAAQNEKRYLLISCSDEHLETLLNFGAFSLDVRYYRENWEAAASNLMVLDATKF